MVAPYRAARRKGAVPVDCHRYYVTIPKLAHTLAFLVDEAYLPAILTVGPMSDDALAQLCAGHPDLNLELSAPR